MQTEWLLIILLLLLIIVISWAFLIYVRNNALRKKNEYLPTLLSHKNEGHFPYRYLHDEHNNILPIVLISAFFRAEKEKEMFNEYVNNRIGIVGITAYKTFPKPIDDGTGDSDTMNDTFDYCENIKNWIYCFSDYTNYGLTNKHNLINMSESDFYDIEDETNVEKKYDFIYVCIDDDDKTCPLDGWNAVNRNFKTALECFPIMVNEFKLKILIIGRVNCGLEKYNGMIETVKFLPYHEFQQKLRQSRFLFVPNIFDASPRVVSEAIIKDIPVLMNTNIVCGSKYINYETGELFTNEHDIRLALRKLLDKKDKISPKKWWKKNYGRKKSAIILRNYLYKIYPNYLNDVKEVYFFN
jgi:hypothetical protein